MTNLPNVPADLTKATCTGKHRRYALCLTFCFAPKRSESHKVVSCAPALGWFLTIFLLLSLCGSANAQNDLSRNVKLFSELKESGKLTEAEAVLKKALPSPLAEPPKKPGELSISAYGLLWMTLISEHLQNADFDSASRITTERIGVAEQTFGRDHIAVAAFLNMLGAILVRQGKYEAATPVFERSLRMFTESGLGDGMVAGPIYAGLAECLLAQKKESEAEALLHPIVRKMGEKSRLEMQETIANTYAVILREIGSTTEAEELEKFIDNKSHLRAGVNSQERDFLRARISAADGNHENADAVYRKWIDHWERWGETARAHPGEQEWDRILMDPLQQYADFLTLAGRKSDAAVIRRRLKEIRAKYTIKGGFQ